MKFLDHVKRILPFWFVLVAAVGVVSGYGSLRAQVGAITGKSYVERPEFEARESSIQQRLDREDDKLDRMNDKLDSIIGDLGGRR